MKTPLITGLVMAVMLLASCETKCVRGIIVKKNYRPAWTQIVLIPISTGKTTMMVPSVIYNPEQWDIVVQNDHTSGDEGQYLIVVSRAYYDSIDVGGIWEKVPK